MRSRGQAESSPAWPPATPAGAIQAIAVDPTNANVVYVGAANGGVWKTINATAASPTWTPLTDQALPALSIDSLSVESEHPVCGHRQRE